MNKFKINDMIIIKMDNYEHQIEHFLVGVEQLLRPINAINHLPPPHPHNMKNGVGVPP
jgi:hypothetical protein